MRKIQVVRKDTQRCQTMGSRLSIWFGWVFPFLSFLWIPPIFLNWFGVWYLPTPAWVQLSKPFAYGAGIVAALAILVAIVLMVAQEIAQEGVAAIMRAVPSWLARLYALAVIIGAPIMSGILLQSSITNGIPMLYTAAFGTAQQKKYIVKETRLQSEATWHRHCADISLVDVGRRLCSRDLPLLVWPGVSIVAEGKGSFFGMFFYPAAARVSWTQSN